MVSRVDEADDGGRAGGMAGDLVQACQVLLDEIDLDQQVFRRIARDRQFGEGHDVRPKRLGFFEPLDDFPGVPFEVTDGGVDLGHGDPEPRRHLAPPGGGGLHAAAPGAAQRLLLSIL